MTVFYDRRGLVRNWRSSRGFAAKGAAVGPGESRKVTPERLTGPEYLCRALMHRRNSAGCATCPNAAIGGRLRFWKANGPIRAGPDDDARLSEAERGSLLLPVQRQARALDQRVAVSPSGCRPSMIAAVMSGAR